ncbi:MAG: hypothetical protein ACRER2_04945 [Methylococcales bacterium]
MNTQFTLDLPVEVAERATQFFDYARRNVSEIVASALPSLDTLAELRNIARLPDREIQALTELRMEPEADRRLSPVA